MIRISDTMLRPKRVKKRPLKLKDEYLTQAKPVEEKSPKREGEFSKIQYEFNEIEDLLAKLHLTYVFLGGHAVFMKSDFDLNVAGEPYIAVMLLLDRTSGRFLSRIWNRSIITPIRQIVTNCN